MPRTGERPKLDPAVPLFGGTLKKGDFKASSVARRTGSMNWLLAEKPDIKVAEAAGRASVRVRKLKIGLIIGRPSYRRRAHGGRKDWFCRLAGLSRHQRLVLKVPLSYAGVGWNQRRWRRSPITFVERFGQGRKDDAKRLFGRAQEMNPSLQVAHQNFDTLP